MHEGGISWDRNRNNIARTAGAAKLTPVRARMQTMTMFFMLADRGLEALLSIESETRQCPWDGKKWIVWESFRGFLGVWR